MCKNQGITHDESQIESPFIAEIARCRTSMRKLRKKIYKYTSTHKPTKKPKDSVGDMLSLLKGRQIPSFLLDSIKKRRTFDVGTVKNMMMPSIYMGQEEVTKIAARQQKEVSQLHKEHRGRFRKEKKEKLRITQYSSTEGESDEWESESNSMKEEFLSSKGEEGHLHRHSFLALEKDLYSQDQWLRF